MKQKDYTPQPPRAETTPIYGDPSKPLYGDPSKPWWCEGNSHIGLDVTKPTIVDTLVKRSSLLDLLHQIQTGNCLDEDIGQAKVLAEQLGFPLDLLEHSMKVGQANYLKEIARRNGMPKDLIVKVEPHSDLKYLL